MSSRTLERDNLITLIQKELLDSLRNRWFLIFTLIFTLLTVGLSWLGLAGIQRYGVSGFGRTTASLINLVILIVPLMGLMLGAMSLAGEREKGTLIYLLAQPVSHLEVLLSKYLGLGIALLTALCLSFGLGGLLLALYGSTTGVMAFLGLVLLTFLVALLSLGLGLLISSGLQKSATALGSALFLWLLFVFLGDLGLLGTSLVLRVPIETLFTLSLLNPLQVFKMAAVLLLRSNLEALGPAGLYAMRAYGDRLLPLFLGLLILWSIVPTLLAYPIFKKRGGL